MGANHFALLQEVALWADGRGKENSEADRSLEHSHLCARSKCCVPSHVVLEHSSMNQRRVGCYVWVHCPHGDCGKKVPVCQHGPEDGSQRCIKFCPGFASYEDFKANGLHEENFDKLTESIGNPIGNPQ
jgi:hypothetical protein